MDTLRVGVAKNSCIMKSRMMTYHACDPLSKYPHIIKVEITMVS